MLLSEIHKSTKEKFDEFEIQTSEIDSRTIIKKILIIIKANANNDISERSSNNFSGYAVSHKLIDVNEEK